MEEIAIELVQLISWAWKEDVPAGTLIIPAIPLILKIAKNKRVRSAAKKVGRWIRWW